MYYLEKKDINEAILFLEESKHDDDKLLSLYKMPCSMIRLINWQIFFIKRVEA